MAASDREAVIYKKKKSGLKPPPMYKIMLLNDDFTPMEFVVEVLQTFFFMSQAQATQIMYKVHTEGSGVCGTYPSDIATTKVEQVVRFARQHQHPLRCVMEKEKN
jgi:ATP-dependent Clp protease adaptor protein ClpS